MNFHDTTLNWILNWINFGQNSNIELNQFGYQTGLPSEPKTNIECFFFRMFHIKRKIQGIVRQFLVHWEFHKTLFKVLRFNIRIGNRKEQSNLYDCASKLRDAFSSDKWMNFRKNILWLYLTVKDGDIAPWSIWNNLSTWPYTDLSKEKEKNKELPALCYEYTHKAMSYAHGP